MLRCLNEEKLLRQINDNLITCSSIEQSIVEHDCHNCYELFRKLQKTEKSELKLLREKHIDFLRKGILKPLSETFSILDSSRPWFIYWIVHSLALFNEKALISKSTDRIIKFLKSCNNPTGGYGGGPGQISHIVTSYAAIKGLVTLCNKEALESIDRKSLYDFLLRMKREDGSFVMHEDGECDVRGAYCAVSIAYICNIQTYDLFRNTAKWIAACQTYEGGFGATPGGDEAHGGYTFCSLAALMLLNETNRIDARRLNKWVLNKQYNYEGGFAGRTNKLVDSCYSFWQGAVPTMVHGILSAGPYFETMPSDHWLFDQQALQEYILCCCQDLCGGLVDKPTKRTDFYHTCYSLAGLSIAQHSPSENFVIGSENNLLQPVHPIHNVTIDAYQFVQETFL